MSDHAAISLNEMPSIGVLRDAFAAATSQRPALEGGTKAMPKLTSSYDEFKKILHNIVR